MNHPPDRGQAPVENTYRIDPSRRLVQIQVRKNVSPDEAVRLYARVFSERDYQAGFSFVVDRRGLSEPPSAGTVRAVVDFLRTHARETGACRMAIVTDEDAPRGAWRGAEMLAITTRPSSCAPSTTSRLLSCGPLAQRAPRKIARESTTYIFVSRSTATYDDVWRHQRDHEEQLARAGLCYGDV